MADDRLTVIGRIKFDKKPFMPLERAANATGKLIGKLEKNTKRLEVASKKTSKNLNKMLDGYNERIKKAEKSSNGMIKKLGGLAAGFVTVGAAFKSVNLASEMVETQTKLNVVFGDMADDANKWAMDYSKTMGFSVLRTKEAMGDIQNLFTGFGMGRQESSAMSKEIIKLANDLDSFNNLTAKGVNVQKTMISALMGETEAAKTLGASILETNLNTAAAEMGLGKYSSKMKESTKIQIRLHAIQMQSKDAMGDVARNLDTEVGKRRRLTAEIQNQQIALGQKLMPIWMKTLDLGLNFIDVIEKNSSTLNKMADTVGSVFEGMNSFIGVLTGTTAKSRALQGVVGTLTGAYTTYKGVALATYAIEKARTAYKFTKSIPATFMENIAIIKNTALLGAQKVALLATNIATKAMTIGQWALNVALNANPIGLVIAGLVGLVAIGVTVYKNFDTIKEKVLGLWETFKNSPLKKVFDLTPLGLFIKGLQKAYGIWKKFRKDKEEGASNKTIGETIPAFAKGTRNAPGGMSLVGENGPELVDLPKGSSVFTNSETKNIYNSSNNSKTSSKGANIAVGGDTITIHITNAKNNAKDLWDELRPMLDNYTQKKRERVMAIYGGA